ncbi:MAG: malate dehydrogenase [Candidatus Dadabacteria bacterium]|nr:MAG: malate dehydrogenase [Candidatus Dadabacteria bacterium]
MKRNKIALIGSGNIGTILALLSVLRNLGDVVMYDIVEGMPQGKALDLSHLMPVLGCDCEVVGTNNIADIKDANVCIVTSGLPRKPGMTRDDLLKVNGEIISGIAESIKEYAPSAFVIVITNPLDAMAYLMQKRSGLPANMVVGMAGVLDSSRYRFFLAQKLQVSVNSVSAFVLGGHGDTMVPVRSYTNCAGIPVSQLLSSEDLSPIEERVKKAGGEIVGLLKTGSAFMSPAASAIRMAESYLFDKKELLPCSAYCSGEYGAENIYLGVPVILGAKGVEKIVEIALTDEEKKALEKSLQAVQSLVSKLEM